jgi:hypothetical protein
MKPLKVDGSTNRSPKSANPLPQQLEAEILYYFKFIHEPHNVSFAAFVNGVTPGLFGSKGSDLRGYTSLFYQKIDWSYEYHQEWNLTLRNLRLTPEQAPHAHRYHQQLLHTPNQHASATMSYNYDKSFSEESEFDLDDEKCYDGKYLLLFEIEIIAPLLLVQMEVESWFSGRTWMC